MRWCEPLREHVVNGAHVHRRRVSQPLDDAPRVLFARGRVQRAEADVERPEGRRPAFETDAACTALDDVSAAASVDAACRGPVAGRAGGGAARECRKKHDAREDERSHEHTSGPRTHLRAPKRTVAASGANAQSLIQLNTRCVRQARARGAFWPASAGSAAWGSRCGSRTSSCPPAPSMRFSSCSRTSRSARP